MAKKIFGGSSKTFKKAKRPLWMKLAVTFLALLLLLEGVYCLAIFTDIPVIKRLRTMYIETAMSTMSHQWLATYFIPGDIVDAVVEDMEAARANQVGQNSNWNIPKPTEPVTAPTETAPPETTEPVVTETQPEPLTAEQEAFFLLFDELDQDAVLEYVKAHPEAVENGWENLRINEAGLDDEGTELYTHQGDQVLAVNAEHQVLLVRVKGSTYRGVLAICKDPSRLKVAVSANYGSYGERVGSIASRNDGVLGITASGFIDDDGHGSGGEMAGGCMASGKTYGNHYKWGYKRIELHEDNRLYIQDAHTGYSEGCTDATEFTPALIVDGEDISGDNIYTSLNPRCCLGQTADEDVLMLVVEGRLATSIGIDAENCAAIMKRYDCFQAMNLDGGTSAIMWYDGEYVTRCSNTSSPEGRYVPNAWVYCSSPIED